MLHLGKPLISEIRFGSQRYIFSILDLSPKITKELFIYFEYDINICLSQHVLTFERFLTEDFEIWGWIAQVFFRILEIAIGP